MSNDWRSSDNFTNDKSIKVLSLSNNKNNLLLLCILLLIVAFTFGYLIGSKEIDKNDFNDKLINQIADLTTQRDEYKAKVESQKTTIHNKNNQITSLEKQLLDQGKRYTTEEINELKENANTKTAKALCKYIDDKVIENKNIKICETIN